MTLTGDEARSAIDIAKEEGLDTPPVSSSHPNRPSETDILRLVHSQEHMDFSEVAELEHVRNAVVAWLQRSTHEHVQWAFTARHAFRRYEGVPQNGSSFLRYIMVIERKGQEAWLEGAFCDANDHWKIAPLPTDEVGPH